MKRLVIITADKEKNREKFFNFENLMTIKAAHPEEITVKFVTGNTQPLAKVYNRHLLDPSNRDAYMLFLHSDAIINDKLLCEKLERGFEEYDVIGVAGCHHPFSLANSGGLCTWHNMCLPENRYGAINTYKQKPFGSAYSPEDPTFRTYFGQTPARVILIDGVFIAVNVEKIWTDVSFDEHCPAKFHFYDLLFSLMACKFGHKVGVIDISVNHISPGLQKVDKEFAEGNRYFGKILNHEGLMKDEVPERPNLEVVEKLETEEGLECRTDKFPVPPLPDAPVEFPWLIPRKCTRVYITRRLIHGKHLGERTKEVPSFVHVPSDKSGCSWWRLCLIDQYGNYSKRANVATIDTTIDSTSFWDSNFDALRIQREVFDDELRYYRMLNRMFSDRCYKTKMIWEIDDIIIGGKLPEFNLSKDAFSNPKIQDNMKRIVDLCDHVTVVSEYMRDLYEPFFMGKECRVLENYSHKGWFDGLYDYEKRMRQYEENKKRPRILLAGGGTHIKVGSTSLVDQGDYSVMMETIIKTRKDFKWVFMGHMPAPLEPFVENGDIEFIPWVNLVEYPVKLDATNAQILLAPLDPNDFNRAKSNIKERESYYLGRPCVVQDLEPYKTALHKFRTADEAMDQIKSILADEQTYGDWCKKYRSLAEGCWLEDVWDDKVLPAYA